MKSAVHNLVLGNVLLACALLTSCVTESATGIQASKAAMTQQIAAEPPGDYFIGRRYFKPDYKFWGYVRKPGEPWSAARMVMLNEEKKLAPDREQMNFGSDNNYEYKMYGHFSGETVYEPASNGFYPEFILERMEVISTNPPGIFKSQLNGREAAKVTRYTIERPWNY